MKALNKVQLIGNLGADPEVRYMASGDAVANLRLATSESWKDRNTGQVQERTEWHHVVLFGKIAEVAQQFLRKGSKVYVEGKLRTRKWQTKEGQDRYTTEIVVDMNGSVIMLDGKPSDPQQQPRPQTTGPRPTTASREPDYGDDIPF